MYKVVEITTPTCSVCKMIKPMVEKVMSGYPAVDFKVYDHEDADVKYYLDAYNIKSVPAFFFVYEGDVHDTHFGAITMPDLKKKVENLVNAG